MTEQISLNEFFSRQKDKSSYLFREFLWILTEVFSLNDAKLVSGLQPLEAKHIQKLEDWVEKRKKDYPIQYFIGSVEFYNERFWIDEGALIPRNETEEIAYWVVKTSQEKAYKTLLDVGAGSGCLGLSVGLHLSSVEEVDLIEPYNSAFKVLKKNTNEFQNKKDWRLHLHKVSYEDFEFQKKYDLILSNPPYICYGDEDVAQGVYEFEPHEALFGGEQGWEKEESWVKKSFQHLNAGGRIVFEISHDQQQVLETKLSSYSPRFYKDSFGKDRYMVIEKG